MTKTQILTYAQQVAKTINTNDVEKIFASYYMNTQAIQAAIIRLGGVESVKAFIRENINKSENELLYL